MKFNPRDFTWGLELEFGDVPRNLTPPYSKWSDRETDIVNTIHPYYAVAADPLGISPAIGGELNTKPTTTIEKQTELVSSILSYFKENDTTPTASCVSHTHVHVHIPNLSNELLEVKKLLVFIYNNQDEMITHANPCTINENLNEYIVDYLKNDSRRKYPRDHIVHLLQRKTFGEFYSDLLINKKKISNYEAPKKYFINLLSLQDNETIEFRFFNSTTNINEIKNTMRFCYSVLDAAFNDKKIDYTIQLPKFNYDRELLLGWFHTKHTLLTDKPKRRIRQETIM